MHLKNFIIESLFENFIFDEISKYTLFENNNIGESANNNFILKRKNWEIDNYERFLEIVDKTPKDLKGFLTQHDIRELKDKNWVVYTLKGYDVAFALHYIGNGQVEICNLVNNNDRLHNIGEYLLRFIKQEGGTTMDNYRGLNGDEGKLGKLYRKMGFDKQTWFQAFDPKYQPENPEYRLNTKKWGKPDVEGLERSKHKMKYNNPLRRYKEKFDKNVLNKFNKS